MLRAMSRCCVFRFRLLIAALFVVAFTSARAWAADSAALLPGLGLAPEFNEQTTSFTMFGDVYLHINAPGPGVLSRSKPTRLIFYALPNGNTTSMTIGKVTGPKDDWHYNIQHIGAQTRRLRELVPEQNWIVVYLEASGKSWPSWRKKHADAPKLIRELVDDVRARFAEYRPRVTLSGHSGGGSFITGFLNGGEAIPEFVERICYIDANYSYSDEEKHGDKLLQWLRGDKSRELVVIAYDDREITLAGKKVVGPDGGTWRATQRMVDRFSREVDLTSATLETSGITRNMALGGQIEILRHPNPENKILHTVLVEKNGFIYGMLAGTREAKRADAFWGESRYSKWIAK